MLLFISAGLLILISLAHSYLGERFILTRLFKRQQLPELYGSQEFTARTLRFAWHLTSVAWVSFAVLLIYIEISNLALPFIVYLYAVTFILHGVIALFASKGKHFSWPIFFIIGGLPLF